MGEHTIREILRRRSPETQRAMQRRRELAGVKEGSGSRIWIVLPVALVLVLGYVAYLIYVGHEASTRFGVDKALRVSRPDKLTVAGATEFLPNTLLAALDPAFYNSGGLTGTVLTRRVIHLFYPKASGLELRAMAVAVEAAYTKSDIMEAFINDAPMGGDESHPVKGFSAASTYYFGKPFTLLAPQDIALLVAIAETPGLDPRKDPGGAQQARDLVLLADKTQNVLGEAVVAGLAKLPLDVTPQPGG